MNKIILITGATSGIGKASAKRLAKKGHRLILCGRREDKLIALEKTLSNYTEIKSLSFDVRFSNEVFHKINSLPESWRNIDVLINNAGNAHGLSPINEGITDDWNAMIDGNIKGVLYLTKAIIPQMINRESGHIINISSIAGKQTYENGAVYCASKKAVEALSEGMRLDLSKHQIKVSNIAPGAVETNFSMIRFKGDVEKSKKVYQGYSPLIADDIADLIEYIIHAPKRVNIADVSILPSAQSSASNIYKQKNHSIN